MGVTNKTPEYLKMNPIGKVPVLETPNGPLLFLFKTFYISFIDHNTLKVEEAAIAGLKRALKALNTYVSTHTYLKVSFTNCFKILYLNFVTY